MKLKYEFEVMNLEDHFVAVPVGEGATEYHGVIKMNDSAAIMFNLLKEETTEHEIVTRLLGEYDGTPKEKIEDYVHSFILAISEKGFIEAK